MPLGRIARGGAPVADAAAGARPAFARALVLAVESEILDTPLGQQAPVLHPPASPSRAPLLHCI
jgi:hypothetical protein